MNQMRRGMVVDYTTVAGMLANEDNHTQAAFLNAFVRALKVECGTSWFTEVQVSAMKHRVDPDVRSILWPDEED